MITVKFCDVYAGLDGGDDVACGVVLAVEDVVDDGVYDSELRVKFEAAVGYGRRYEGWRGAGEALALGAELSGELALGVRVRAQNYKR